MTAATPWSPLTPERRKARHHLNCLAILGHYTSLGAFRYLNQCAFWRLNPLATKLLPRVEDGRTVLSSVIASQMVIHGKYGGVVPELASREHLRAIVPVVREALDLSARASRIWHHRGHRRSRSGRLAPVGLTYAKSLSFASGVPLIAVTTSKATSTQ